MIVLALFVRRSNDIPPRDDSWNSALIHATAAAQEIQSDAVIYLSSVSLKGTERSAYAFVFAPRSGNMIEIYFERDGTVNLQLAGDVVHPFSEADAHKREQLAAQIQVSPQEAIRISNYTREAMLGTAPLSTEGIITPILRLGDEAKQELGVDAAWSFTITTQEKMAFFVIDALTGDIVREWVEER